MSKPQSGCLMISFTGKLPNIALQSDRATRRG
jgi:hypothetical protein